MTKPQCYKVLLVHRYLWPENLSLYPAMLKEIAEAHCEVGDQVTIVTAAPTTETERALREAWAAEHGITLHEIALPVDRGLPHHKRLVTMARFALFAARHCFRQTYDGVSVASYPFLIGPAVVVTVARLRKKRSLLYVQDILSSRIANRSDATRFAGVVAGFIDRQLVRLASTTVTLSTDMKTTLRGNERVHVLQNFLIDEPPHTSLEAPQTRSDDVEFVYAGNLGAAQNLSLLIDAAEIAARQAEFSLVLLGSGSEEAALKKKVEARQLDCVSFLGRLPRDEATERIALADVGVVAAEPQLFSSAFPSKTLSYMQAGLPILVMCEPDGEVARQLEALQLGIAGSPTDTSELATAIVKCVERVERNEFDSSSIRATATQSYGRAAYFTTYLQEIRPSWLLASHPRRKTGIE